LRPIAADRPFSLYAVDTGSGAVRRLNGTGSSAQSPAVSPDGETLLSLATRQTVRSVHHSADVGVVDKRGLDTTFWSVIAG
jgi:sugar lactone lactonase YvrE